MILFPPLKKNSQSPPRQKAMVGGRDPLNSALPQLLEVPLGGQMKINTADGPMLVNVANQMRCQQCASAFGNMHGCPCSVDVTGSKDGQYYEGEASIS